MTYQIGAGKKEITCFIPGIGMMGYGQGHNTVKEIATPLQARSLVIKENGKTFYLINLEQAFVTIALKAALLTELSKTHPEWQVKEEELMLTAQHTHSAPGGYSHFPMYNFTIPGFRPQVVRTVVKGIIESLEEAHQNLSQSELSYEETFFPENMDVAFNRSMKAYLQNPEAKKLKAEESHLAVDRSMKAIRVKDQSGKDRALFSWFAVHCTSVSSFNHRIHHDNKGVAAALYEQKHPGVVAAFLQDSAGDVSPNYVWDKKLKRTRGKFVDQYENAAYNGELQYKASESLSKKAQITGDIQSVLTYINMEVMACSPAHGMAFFTGTLEGPGIPQGFANILKKLADTMKKKHIKNSAELREFYSLQEPKTVFLDHKRGNFLGLPIKLWKKLPVIPDPAVGRFIKEAKSGALETKPWVPHILPLQLTRLGSLLIAGVPGEITTVAGERLKNMLKEKSKNLGVKEVILASYANAYMGYITTAEEYQMQCYEGGHNVYGYKCLEAIMTGFSYLAQSLSEKKETPRGFTAEFPFHFPEKELQMRTVI